MVWTAIARWLGDDWSRAHNLTHRQWEELLAGAFAADGYDEVVLTPRSADHGRDVIATKRGVGTVRILAEMKAYRPNRQVRYESIRALIGVLEIDRKASKAILATTGKLPPLLAYQTDIASLVPTRLELLDGPALRAWLARLAMQRNPPTA